MGSCVTFSRLWFYEKQRVVELDVCVSQFEALVFAAVLCIGGSKEVRTGSAFHNRLGKNSTISKSV